MESLTDPVLDEGSFDELYASLGSRPDALADLYYVYFENASDLIRTLRMESAAMREHVLHSLRGSSSMVGAKRLAALSARLVTKDQNTAVEQLTLELIQFREAVAERLRALGYEAPGMLPVSTGNPS